jgi:DNA repair exonuclease SbcCD nuclease subunit
MQKGLDSPIGELQQQGSVGGSDSLVLVHSSDLHIDSTSFGDSNDQDAVTVLRCVIDAANEVSADVLLLAGDTFEHNRLPMAILQLATDCLSYATLPVVILPGNHDPLTTGSVYERSHLADLPNVHVIGHSGISSVLLEELDLEIWGNAHLDYGDMRPLRDPPQRRTRWQVFAAHGHVAEPPYPEKYRPSWLMSQHDLGRTGADYVALGHWDRDRCISTDPVPAYYSGSPRLTGAVNVVSFSNEGGVQVTRQAVSSELTLLTSSDEIIW